jgi:hypothetical protein
LFGGRHEGAAEKDDVVVILVPDAEEAGLFLERI